VKNMNKFLKMAPILLLMGLMVSITPISAMPIHEKTHIHGLNDKTVHQGDKFTLDIQVVYKGAAGRERGITSINHDALYLCIYNGNSPLYRHNVSIPRVWGNEIKVDTSNFQPGTYKMTVYFNGEGCEGRFRDFEPCSRSATLTVLPRENA
jgi:hypothetical protein